MKIINMLPFETERQLAPPSKFLSKEGLMLSLDYFLSSESSNTFEFALKTIVRISFLVCSVELLAFLFSFSDLGTILVTFQETAFFVVLVLFNLTSIGNDFFSAYAFQSKNGKFIRRSFFWSAGLYASAFGLFVVLCVITSKRPETLKDKYPIQMELEVNVYTYINLALVFIGFNLFYVGRLVLVYKSYQNIQKLLENSDI